MQVFSITNGLHAFHSIKIPRNVSCGRAIKAERRALTYESLLNVLPQEGMLVTVEVPPSANEGQPAKSPIMFREAGNAALQAGDPGKALSIYTLGIDYLHDLRPYEIRTPRDWLGLEVEQPRANAV